MIRFDGVSGVATDKQQLLWAQVAVLATLEIELYLLGENYFFEQLQDVEFRIDFRRFERLMRTSESRF